MLVADGATLLSFKPLIDALGVVLMRALRQLLKLLASLKVVETNGASVLGSVALLHPRLLFYSPDLCRSQPF